MNNTQTLYPRLLETRIAEAMADTPVVLVVGPRQAGKTTLVRRIAAQEMRCLTLDDELTLLAAKESFTSEWPPKTAGPCAPSLVSKGPERT